MKNDIPAILFGLAILAAIGGIYCRYTRETETKADDRIGAIIGHIAGFLRFVLDVVRGKR